MTGEDFFKFNKGNEFRFSNFREIKEEDLKGADEKTKKLFNIFAGEDKILQEVEAKSLFNVLKSAAGDNKVLEDNEIKAFAKEHIGEDVDTNILATFVNNIFGTKENPQTQTVQVGQNVAVSKQQQTFLEEAACKEIVIDIIDENLSEAYEILNSQYLGAISGRYDESKDKNNILKTSNVSKVLDYQNAGIEWMNKAKLTPPKGLTKKEYYEGNKQRIKDMILTRVLVLDTNTKFKELKNKYSEEKLAQIIGDYVEQLCSNASMEDLKAIQKQFVSYSGVEEIQALENVVDNAIKFNADKNFEPIGELPVLKMNIKAGIVPEYWNSDEPISFEEVYKIERGTEYSQYKIEQYALAKKEMEVVANAYNKKQQFVEFAEGLRKDETLNVDEKIQKVLEGFATFYALSEDGGLSQLQELIAKSKLPISIDENGFNFGTLDDNAKNRALNSLLKFAQQSKEKEFEEFLNGKTIEDYQKALAQAQSDAIGDENGKMMAEAMRNDNLTCIQRWAGNTSMAGMGMTIVGGILCFTPLAPLGAGMITVGNTLAIGGMVAKTGLGVTDYATKDVQTAEEAEQLTKDFIVDAGGFIIGMGAGKAGVKAFSKLIDKKLVAVFGQQIASGNKMQALKTVFTNPEYLKNFMKAAGAKLSADFVISYAGDLAMMGILDTQDDWQSLLKANLTGILVGMSGDIKDVSGVGRPHNFGVSEGVKGVNEASRFDQPTSPHVKKPMTEMDYGQRLLGNDVTVVDPKTGTTVEGTVTGLYSQNGRVEIEVNGQRYSTNDVAEVKGEARVKTDSNNSTPSRFSYEVSRNINRVKRAVQYVEDKVVGAYKGTKKSVEGISKVIDFVSLDSKLKNLGIKDKLHRDSVIDFLKNTPIESNEIYDGLLKSIGKMKELQVRDNDIQSVLYYISNSNKQFDQSSLDIINELSNLHQKAKENWNDRTVKHLLSSGRDKAEKLEYLREFSATLDAGYKFDDVEFLINNGIKGEDGRSAYKEILNSEFVQRTKGGLGAEYSATEYFKVCCDEKGKFNPEYWNILQNMDKVGINQPKELLKVLKNKDPEITKANIEAFMAKFEQNPTQFNNDKSASLVQKCMTKEGKLDFSRLEYAQIVNKLGIDSKYLQNKDGSYNQDAINIVTSLKENGFRNEDLHNILLAAQKTPKTIDEGAIYSRDIIQKAIELKNAGVATKNIGNMLNDCIENGKLNVELLENITPICKMLDTYTMTETEWLIPTIQCRNGETQKQIVAQIQKLMQNGFKIYDIQKCEIFDFKNNIGTITPDNIIDAAIQLKQVGFDWNIKNILTKSRCDDGSLNTKSLNLIIDLKNKGISESYIDEVLGILTTEKGELLKNNVDTVLSLLKEYKDSEFCNASKETKQDNDWEAFTLSTNKIASDYISENGNNVSLVSVLIKMSSDEAGSINIEALNANKSKLAGLYNKLEAEDKNHFVFFLRLAVNKQGTFNENIFNKINELKYLDDGGSDPNYYKTIYNFLDACRDENGNLDIQKYDDAIMLVQKHKMSKHEASYTIGLYEEIKPYRDKKFVYDLSITEKRQLQSLLLSHSNNLDQLTKVKNILKADIIPTTDTGYSTLMKQLSQSLGDTNYVLDKIELDNLHNNMSSLTSALHNNKPIEEVSVDVTYHDLLKRIQSKMSGLSESEKHKIYDYFGFTIKNGEIAGFPSYLGKNITSSDITNSFTKKVVQAVTSELENVYKNNTITVKDNPELSQILTSISKSVPEVYNKFSSRENAVSTLKSLKAMTETPSFAKLSDNEKQVLILSALLKDSNVGTTKETAFNIYNLSSKFNMTDKDRQNLYRLLTMSELIAEYKNTKVGEKGSFNNRWGSPTVEYDKKEVALDMLAFEMKGHNLDNLSYLLYSTGENKLISPELQTEIKQRIYEIKSDDFILPQTHTRSIREHAKKQTINGHEVLVANVQDIPDFYAYVHTPDAGAVNHASRTTKFSNFEEFQNMDSDAVICTSYISADKNATWKKNGFIFDVSTGNEYVGMGHDMFSLGKNKQQVVAEYYRNKGLKALSGKGYKYSHRSFISSHLKDILHITENSYSDLIINKRTLNGELEKLAPNSSEAIAIQAQITQIDSEIKRINDNYVARMDRVKSHISSNQINIEEIGSIDPELADAYEQFLARDNTGHKFGKEALMRNDYWNEVLVGNPTISAIYTKDINNIPEEYLIKAQEENLPIVIINN